MPICLPGEQWELRLAVRRKDMPSSGDALYQSLLEVTDAAGSTRYTIPVTSEGLTPSSSVDLQAAAASSQIRAGLWIGSATITNVSQPAVDPNMPVPTASAFQFRLIIHVDENGQARLLQKVIQMWKNGVTNEAGPRRGTGPLRAADR